MERGEGGERTDTEENAGTPLKQRDRPGLPPGEAPVSTCSLQASSRRAIGRSGGANESVGSLLDDDNVCRWRYIFLSKTAAVCCQSLASSFSIMHGIWHAASEELLVACSKIRATGKKICRPTAVIASPLIALKHAPEVRKISGRTEASGKSFSVFGIAIRALPGRSTPGSVRLSTVERNAPWPGPDVFLPNVLAVCAAESG